MKTVGKILSVMLIFALAVALSSCGSGGVVSTIGDESSITASEPGNVTAAAEGEVSGTVPYEVSVPPKASSDECLSAYASFLKKYITTNGEELSNDACCFTLINVDNDDIPELVVSPNDYHGARAELYVYDGGSVKKLGEYGQWGTLSYIERKGLIVDTFTQSGTIDRTVYRLSRGTLEKVCSYLEEPVLTGDYSEDEEVFRYYIDDKEVPPEEYNKSCSENIPSEPVWVPELSGAGVFPLNADGIKKCFETGGGSTKSGETGSAGLYAPVIKNYGKERVETAALAGYDISVPAYEYAIKDINSDGVDELVILEKGEDSPGVIGAIYTLKGNTPLELYFMERHGSYSISSDGYFIFRYHEVTIEKLVGTELVTVAESQRLSDENNDTEYKNFLAANGVSTEEMKFDYVPVNG